MSNNIIILKTPQGKSVALLHDGRLADIGSLPQEIGATVAALNGLSKFTRAGLEAVDYFRFSPENYGKFHHGSNFRRK